MDPSDSNSTQPLVRRKRWTRRVEECSVATSTLTEPTLTKHSSYPSLPGRPSAASSGTPFLHLIFLLYLFTSSSSFFFLVFFLCLHFIIFLFTTFSSSFFFSSLFSHLLLFFSSSSSTPHSSLSPPSFFTSTSSLGTLGHISSAPSPFQKQPSDYLHSNKSSTSALPSTSSSTYNLAYTPAYASPSVYGGQ